MNLEQRVKKKYWIKPGKEVAHREFPERKMIVEDVIKKTEQVIDPRQGKIDKQFIIGVDCHWFDKNGRYDRGRFLTMELIEFGENETEVAEDSFREEIPSTDKA